MTPLPAREHTSKRDIRRQAKNNQILEAATSVFLKSGYSGSSIDDISKLSGVSKRTIYQHYENKEELFIGVVDFTSRRLFDRIERANDVNALEALRNAGEAVLQIYNSSEVVRLCRVVIAEAERFPLMAQQFFEDTYQRIENSISLILIRARDTDGWMISDTKRASHYFLDVLTGVDYMRVMYGTALPMSAAEIRDRTQRALDYFSLTFRLPSRA